MKGTPALDPRFALLAGLVCGMGCAAVALLSWLTSWDVRLAEMDSFLPSVALHTARFLFAAAAFVMPFPLVLFAFSRWRPLQRALRPWLEDSWRVASAQGIGVLLPVAAIGAAAVAGVATLEGDWHPWLWAASANVAAGLAVGAFAHRDWRPADAPARLRASRAAQSAARPDPHAWWSAFLDGPRYHGQVRRTWSIPASAPGAPATAPNAPVLKTLYGQGVPIPPHVASAFAALASPGGGEVHMLDFFHGAGLPRLLAALAIYRAQHRSGRTLVIVPSATRAARLADDLGGAISRDIRWQATMAHALVTGAAELEDLGVHDEAEVPQVLVTTLEGLDAVLRKHGQHPWDEFFPSVSLVAILGAAGLTGTVGNHAALLFRRLRLQAGRSGSTPDYLVECLGALARPAFLQQLLGRSFADAPHFDSRAAARKPVSVVTWVPNTAVGPGVPPELSRRPFLEEVAALAGSALESGLRVTVAHLLPGVAHEDLGQLAGAVHAAGPAPGIEVLTADDLPEADIRARDVLIVAGMAGSQVEVARHASMLGADGSGGICIYVVPHEARALALVRSMPVQAPEPVLQPHNPAILDVHLRALVGSGRFTLPELRQLDHNNVQPLFEQMLADGEVQLDEGVRVDSVEPSAAHRAAFAPRLDVHAAGAATVTLRTDVGQPVAIADPARAARLAHDGALLVIDGVRYRAADNGGQEPVLTAVAVPDQVTKPILRVTITSREDGSQTLRNLADGKLVLDKRLVTVCEAVAGYTRGSISRPSAGWQVNHFGSVRPGLPFDTSAFTLGFEGNVRPDAATLQAFAAVLRLAAEFHLRFDPADLGAEALPSCSWLAGIPAVVFYDESPLGTGLAGKLDLHHQEIFQTAADILIGCMCAHGCPACVGTVVEAPGRDPGRKLEILTLLEEMV